MAKQEFKDETDINTILRRFAVTRQLPESVRMPTYGDFTGLTDFHEAMNAIVAARESFMEMPASVRKRFDNDPGEFVAFCSNPNNLDEARKMGLAPPKPQDRSITTPGPVDPSKPVPTLPLGPKPEPAKPPAE